MPPLDWLRLKTADRSNSDPSIQTRERERITVHAKKSKLYLGRANSQTE